MTKQEKAQSVIDGLVDLSLPRQQMHCTRCKGATSWCIHISSRHALLRQCTQCRIWFGFRQRDLMWSADDKFHYKTRKPTWYDEERES